jgi:hypothetical protein
MPWFIPIILAVATTAGSAVATRLITGPSTPSQKQIEAQLKLQHELEIQRMLEQQKIQERQVDQLAQYAPLALGALVLVAVLS